MPHSTSGTTTAHEALATTRDLLAEAFVGPGPDGSWFVTARPDAGLFGTIRDLSPGDASLPGRPGGPSIAAHVEHLRWWLEMVHRTLGGEAWNPDWSGSWSVSEVDDASWRTLQDDLRREYDAVMAALASPPDELDPMMFKGILAMAPHAAYHLGAIRQLALQRGEG